MFRLDYKAIHFVILFIISPYLGVHMWTIHHHIIEDQGQQYHRLEELQDYNNLRCHMQKTLMSFGSKRLYNQKSTRSKKDICRKEWIICHKIGGYPTINRKIKSDKKIQ
jgi:hypothetical protein